MILKAFGCPDDVGRSGRFNTPNGHRDAPLMPLAADQNPSARARLAVTSSPVERIELFG